MCKNPSITCDSRNRGSYKAISELISQSSICIRIPLTSFLSDLHQYIYVRALRRYLRLLHSMCPLPELLKPGSDVHVHDCMYLLDSQNPGVKTSNI